MEAGGKYLRAGGKSDRDRVPDDRFQAVRIILDPLGLVQLERVLSPHEQRLYDELCEELDLIEWEACQVRRYHVLP